MGVFVNQSCMNWRIKHSNMHIYLLIYLLAGARSATHGRTADEPTLLQLEFRYPEVDFYDVMFMFTSSKRDRKSVV